MGNKKSRQTHYVREEEGRVPRQQPRPPRFEPSPPKGPPPKPTEEEKQERLFTARPPLHGKASHKELISMAFKDVDISDPFSEMAQIAQNDGWGQQGGIGFHCYNCRAEILDRKRAMLSEEHLYRCPSCNKINSSILAARICPVDPGTASWFPFTSDDNCYRWIRVLTRDEELEMKAEIEKLLELDEQELQERISQLGVEIDELPSKFDDARKEELAQYLLVYDIWDPSIRAQDGYIRELLRSKKVLWSRVGKYRCDPTEWKDRPIEAQTLCAVAALPLEKRLEWLRTQLDALRYVDEYEGPLRVFVHRDKLLEDASNWINALQDNDKWRTCRYEFVGEPAMDSGGVAKEWYRLVCDSCFQPGYGLFERIDLDDITYSFNPQSGVYNPERHLYYYRFAGRILAKAIFEGCFVEAHLSKVVYKHIVGRPCTLEDLKYVDSDVYKSMMDILENPDAVEDLFLDFTVTTSSALGGAETVELKPGGAEIEVTKENLGEYIKLYVKYVLYDRIAIQLDSFLKGFHEVIPQPLLSVFNHDEFENIMCGISQVDVDDWRQNVTYRAEFKEEGEDHPVIQWFWEVVNEFSMEDRSKLLQYVTGSSRVPMNGFKGFDEGDSLLISIESIETSESVFPRAHTCFNRLELPLYTSKSELKERLTEAMQIQNGFNLE